MVKFFEFNPFLELNKMNTLSMGPSTIENTASILVNNAIAVLNEKHPSSQRLDEAIRPFAAAQWTREVLNHITVAKMNRLIGRLKRSSLPKATLRLITAHFQRALIDEPAIIPLHFTEWRDIVMRTGLNHLADPDTWLAVWEALATHRIPDPPTLARVSLLEIHTVTDTSLFGDLIQSLWQAVRIEFAHATTTPGSVVAFRQNVSTPPEALRAPNAELTTIGLDFEASKLDIGLPSNFESLGPTARIAALQDATPDSQQMMRFLSTGAQTNVLQQVRLTLLPWRQGYLATSRFARYLASLPFHRPLRWSRNGALCLATEKPTNST